jgi:hypothetical protein
MSAVALLGRILSALTIAAVVIGWACWKWLSGAQWHHSWTGRRLVTRPVRAAGQSLLTAVVIGLALAPVATGAVVATVILTLAVAAGGYRTRLWLDAREAARPGPVRAQVIEQGAPIRHPVAAGRLPG